jgi:hypothetical protein
VKPKSCAVSVQLAPASANTSYRLLYLRPSQLMSSAAATHEANLSFPELGSKLTAASGITAPREMH